MPSSKEEKSLENRDANAVIHGLTNLKIHAERGATVINSGRGVWVKDISGREFLEAMSGLWCVALGYGNKRLANIASKQMLELAYCPLINHRSHPPVIALAEKLLSISPVPMARVWFASTGSEANDCAARLVWYFWNACGEPTKKKFISHELAYHGNTIATASLSGVSYAHEKFNLPLPGFIHVETPHYSRLKNPGESEELFAERMVSEVEKVIQKEGPENIAAFFIEPVMAAGGVIVPPISYFEKLQTLLKKHSILIVCDEVVTAFGRTGEMFGSTTMKLQPDIIVCAKALSSAYIPISAVMVSPSIYRALERQSGELGIFGLTLTYSGHPVASAVALEALNIYEELKISEHVKNVGSYFLNKLREFTAYEIVREIRGIGLLAGVELKENLGAFCAHAAELEGLIVRAIGNTIAFCPPLIISEREVDQLINRFKAALDRTSEFQQTIKP